MTDIDRIAREGLAHPVQFVHPDTHAALCAAVIERGEEIERLRAALEKYGEHGSRCAYHAGTYDEPRYCDCGLDAALRGKETT